MTTTIAAVGQRRIFRVRRCRLRHRRPREGHGCTRRGLGGDGRISMDRVTVIVLEEEEEEEGKQTVEKTALVMNNVTKEKEEV